MTKTTINDLYPTLYILFGLLGVSIVILLYVARVGYFTTKLNVMLLIISFIGISVSVGGIISGIFTVYWSDVVRDKLT